MSSKLQIRLFLSWIASVYLMAASTTVQAAEMALSRSPLFLGTSISPNIFFMLDDSGSMDWETLTPRYQYFENYWRNYSLSPITGGLFTGDSGTSTCGDERTYYYVFDNSDDVYGGCNLEDRPGAELRDWRVRSADLNIMYYNPSATYQPWPGFTNANFNSVRSHPESTNPGYSQTRNLAGFVYDVWIDNLGYDEDGSVTGEARGPSSVVDGANEMVDLWDSHTTYTVNLTDIDVEYLTTTFASVDGALSSTCNSADAADTPQYEDCFGTSRSIDNISGSEEDPWGRTFGQAQQNIANWYQYHRRRAFVMKAAVARVMESNDTFRFGLSILYDPNDLFEEVPLESVLEEDYPTHNAAALDALFAYRQRARGTRLRSGLELAGRYYSDALSGKTNPIISACQQNYSVLFTDGYWSSSDSLTSAIVDNDGDGNSDTLADVAHYYYNQDLSPLPNDVPTSPSDQNEAQHMVTFTVAFGVVGNLEDTDDDGWPNPALEEDGAWTNGSINTEPEKIDDTWHAAFNSKGTFVSAQTTEGVASAIAEALLEISDRIGSAASVATNTGSLNAGSHLFQARFDSSDWKGQLLAFQINLDGSINGTTDWEAGAELNAQDYDTGREIITYNPDADVIPGGDPEGQGVPFRFPADYTSPDALVEMSTSQTAALMTTSPWAINTVDVNEISTNQAYGSALVNYLRGDEANEGAGQDFRIRGSILGDIVNSDPKFVKESTGRYADDFEAKSYNDFVTLNESRAGVVYVGANEGMLHGFDELTGQEVLAYVPNAAYEHLYELTSEDYEHRYYVDAGPNIIDVFMANMDDPNSVSNGLWRTALVGGLGGGGQGIYALDVTDPSIYDEANAASIALWEFDDGDDVDLGYTYSRPQIAKMADGSWAAVFGNGYNNTEADGNASTTGHAVLYIVDIETGDLIKKIDTLAGDVATPNGLATPLMIDHDADSIVDYIYAGDLLGNMWKFDVTSANSSAWNSDFVSAGTPDPLFTTPTGQPITSQPQATTHPDDLGGFMIFFGTGKYIEILDNDPTGQTTQSFYAIWDKNTGSLTPFNSSDLLAQTITNQYQQEFDTDGDSIDDETFTLRDVSDNEISWDSHMGWKLDLIPLNVEGSANVSNFGERQVSNAIVRGGRIIFTTLVPSSVECEFGGTSFLMELDFRSGGALEFPAFDLNSDGEYDGDDTEASGRASDVGIMPTVSILADGAQDVAFGSGASGDIDVIQLSVGVESFGRQSWRQLE
ncbi:MAG: pilus assembly protein [SAR86 cluster bacterium]|uniref:Pilus assembly protein n=1 Tax=SAR86 cluster bacterium TaxID=2030880 RepID=A0A2A4WXU8_9GAMM|nr:MAG: pilus assembly protein [SAR86 cluster bacterium]